MTPKKQNIQDVMDETSKLMASQINAGIDSEDVLLGMFGTMLSFTVYQEMKAHKENAMDDEHIKTLVKYHREQCLHEGKDWEESMRMLLKKHYELLEAE